MIREVVLDIPPFNLVGGELLGMLQALLGELDGRDDVRVVVFRSADPDFFLMHGDVEQLAAVPAHDFTPPAEPNVAVQTFRRLSDAPFVSIGVLDGYARGGGCEFLSALDLRVGTRRAVVGQPEVAMGILPGAGGTVRWPRLVGRARALEIILTGRDVGADELVAIGWLQGIDVDVDALARRIDAMPAASIAAVKRVLDADDPWLTESTELARLMASGAHVEPMRRFLAAGGQTREGETRDIAPLLGAMLDG